MSPLSPYEWDALRLSLFVATSACVIFMPLACLWAIIYDRLRFPGRQVLDTLFHLPLVVPPVVIGYLLLYTLGRHGVLGGALYRCCGLTLAFTVKAAVLSSGTMALPLMIRSLRTSLDSADRRLEEAARTLGASPLDAFFSVTLAQILPGVVSALLLGFVRAFGEFGATITFAGSIPGKTRTLSLALYNYTLLPGGENAAARLAIVSFLAAALAMLASEALRWRHKRWYEHLPKK